jgi:hypothetical protein
MSARCLNERHINAIDVGPFFAIDFDVHKLTVHNGRHFLAFERLVRHDVAPVASRVTDGKKDWFVFLASPRKSVFTPRMPINRVIGVLEQIRGFLPGKAIGMFAAR